MMRPIAFLTLFVASISQGAIEPIRFSQETLDNGLRVIYAPLRQAPVIHVRLIYHVGSRDERPDRQGFAHMFEHMMFRGSAHVAPEEHMKRINDVGGYSNAFTSFDETVYVNTIPSQYLDLALWLEADRMASFRVSPEIYRTERNVVAEEWRMRMNRPYGDLYEQLHKLAFTKIPYRWTPIGDMDDLRAAGCGELQAFFNRYYVPNNATLVIGGDFNLDVAQTAVRRYFGWIGRGADVVRESRLEPAQAEPRRKTIEQPAPLPAIVIGFVLPPYRSDDHYPLQLLASILGHGDSSRLKRMLVNSAAPSAVDAWAMHMPLADAGLFGVGAFVLANKSADEVEAMLMSAIATVIEHGIEPAELEKARMQARTSLINERQTAEQIAAEIGEEVALAGDAQRVNRTLERLDAVIPRDIQRVAQQYLLPARSNTLRIDPSRSGPATRPVTPAAEVATGEAVAPREVRFPPDYPTTAPVAAARANPEFRKGVESDMNGVRVIVMPDHRLPLVTWTLAMRRGSQSDPPGKEGTAWMTAEMVRRGVRGMSFDELSADLDARGINITMGDGGDVTRLSGRCMSDQFEMGIERSRQILHEPTFPSEEFATLQRTSIDSLRMQQDNPGTVAANEITTAIFAPSPIGRYATPESLARVTLEDVKAFYAANYRSRDAVLIIAGDLDESRGRELARQLVDPFASRELPPMRIELPAHPATRRIILVDRPEGKQATVRMAVRAYDIHSDDKFAGSIASQVLSSGIEARLMRYVRAEKGLAYDCRGNFSPNRQAGTFTAAVDTRIETTADAIRAMFRVFADMRWDGITSAELGEAQQRVAGGMVMGMQTVADQASYRLEGILNGYPIDYYDRYPQRIAAVTGEQVREVMRKYVDDGRLTIVVVAPAEAVKAQLESLGSVEVLPMPARRGATTQPDKAGS